MFGTHATLPTSRPRGIERVFHAAADRRPAELGLLLIGSRLLSTKLPVLRAGRGVRDVDAGHDVHSRRDGEADLERERGRVEVAALDGQLIGDEVIPVAAGAAEDPVALEPRSTRPDGRKGSPGSSRGFWIGAGESCSPAQHARSRSQKDEHGREPAAHVRLRFWQTSGH